MNLELILILAPPILLAVTFHEYAHGWVAHRLGDPTAEQAGRLTLNPISHLDPIGTIMLFVVHFGWAKPVPVNPMNLENPKKDMFWVSIAGPGSNLLLALAFGMGVRLFGVPQMSATGATGLIGLLQFMFVYGVIINVALAVFNLLPIPPLDGSKLLHAIVPDRYEVKYQQFQRYGPMVLIGLIAVGMMTDIQIFGAFLRPAISIFSTIFAGIDLSAGM